MNIGVKYITGKKPESSLVLHLDAGNLSSYSSGTSWNDLSGKGNNFTLFNGASYDSDGGGSILFDGTNDYAGGSIQNKTQFTYLIWCKVLTKKIGGSFLSTNASFTGAPFSFLQFGGTLNMQYNDVTTAFSPALNTWVLLTCVQNGGIATLYSNTTSRGSAVKSYSTGTDVVLGKRYDGFNLNSKISSIQIHDRALTVGEITTYFNATKTRYGII